MTALILSELPHYETLQGVKSWCDFIAHAALFSLRGSETSYYPSYDSTRRSLFLAESQSQTTSPVDLERPPATDESRLEGSKRKWPVVVVDHTCVRRYMGHFRLLENSLLTYMKPRLRLLTMA